MDRALSWLRRRQTAAGALLLYTALALAMMAPLAPEALPAMGADDTANHISGVIEARNALAEGQFPIRVPPHQNHQERYPLYQFYGNFPYTACGAVYLIVPANPYDVWKGFLVVCLVGGAFFTYRLGRTLTRQALPGVAAGVVFVTAPYLLTDIHGRSAFTELVSLTLLPAVFYFTWRAFAGRGGAAVLGCGIAWALLALTHNVTFLYASLLVGLFFLSFLGPWRRLPRRWLGVGAGYGLGLLLCAWYLAAQQAMVPNLCQNLLGPVGHCRWLTPLGVLLAPSPALPDHVPSLYIFNPEHFGLQIGWPILAAAALALSGLRQARSHFGGRRAVLARLLALFALAALLVWTPVDFWPYIPGPLAYVQFSYRLLMFVVLFGSVLAAYALVLGLEGRMRPIHLAVVVIAAGCCAAPYLGPHRRDPALAVEKEIASPNVGRGGATVCFQLGAHCLVPTSLTHPDVNWAGVEFGGLIDAQLHFHRGEVQAVLPAPHAGDVLLLEGEVAPTLPELALKLTLDGEAVPLPPLPPGPFKRVVNLPTAAGKDSVVVVVQADPIREPLPPPQPGVKKIASFALTKLQLRPAAPPTGWPRLVPAATVFDRMEFGEPSVLRWHVSETSLVQLPVAYYPGMQEVVVDGTGVPVQNLGRFVAVELPPGDHEIQVSFVGVRWANGVSLAAWVGVGLAAAALALRRCWPRRRPAGPQFRVRLARVALLQAARHVAALKKASHDSADPR
jgi:hypothetical protein